MLSNIYVYTHSGRMIDAKTTDPLKAKAVADKYPDAWFLADRIWYWNHKTQDWQLKPIVIH